MEEVTNNIIENEEVKNEVVETVAKKNCNCRRYALVALAGGFLAGMLADLVVKPWLAKRKKSVKYTIQADNVATEEMEAEAETEDIPE